MIEWKFHHVGVITADLQESVAFYCEIFGYSASQTFDDPAQGADIVLLHKEGTPMIELICPTSASSPAAGWIKRILAGPYHTCYQVSDIPEVLGILMSRGLKLVFGPAPARAFNDASIAFVWGKEIGLLELVEL